METPYYAVIFSSVRTEGDNGYAEMAERMEELARIQHGYIGFKSARAEIGISVSYWRTLEDISAWQKNAEHLIAQQKGKELWYNTYRVRICKVELEYAMPPA